MNEPTATEVDTPIDFRTDPSRYRHWKLHVEDAIATLTLDVDEGGGLRPGYRLKLNSYDLGVDIELHDALQRIRFEHPTVRVVVLTSGKNRVFSAGANIDRVAATIATFPPARQADLWVGVGVGCAYVGGVDRADIETLQTAAGPYQPQLALGTAVVAKGRQRAGNPAPHTDLACEVLCGVSM